MTSEKRTASEIIRYCAPTAADAAPLGTMAREAFSETFAHRYEQTPFASFLTEAYGVGGKMGRDLTDPAIRWQMAAIEDRPIGYAKLS
jgi:hypothetical protein